MKKIIPLLLLVAILSSCGAHKHTSYTKKKPTTVRRKRITDSKKNIKKHKTTPRKDIIDVSNNKTVYNNEILTTLYKDKPNLSKLKIDYIKKYGAMAIHEMENYKIPASITLAQGLLESRYGQSILTTKAKNHFGIKCHNWEGDRVYHDDDKKGECFRKYEHAESSFRDHSLFLYHKKRYEKLFKLAPNDYKGWAKGLRAAGYATDKKYPAKLIELIEKYELYYFDNLVLGKNYENKDLIEHIDEKPKESQNQIKPKKEIAKKQFILDKTKIYIVGAGETLYAIARANNISVDKLKQYNDLTSNDIAVGQELKMYSPENKTDNTIETYIIHKVKKGDTMYSIARKYKVTITDLLKFNNMESTEISIGQEIKVKKTK